MVQGSIYEEFFELLQSSFTNYSIPIPKIKELVVPSLDIIQSSETFINKRSCNFGLIILENDIAGICYLNLHEGCMDVVKKGYQRNVEIIGKDPFEIISRLMISECSSIDQIIGMGTINALSQLCFNTVPRYSSKNSKIIWGERSTLDFLDLSPTDHVGMVGFFPPIIEKLEAAAIRTVVIEKKPELVRKSEYWHVSLDPHELIACNKLIITATTVLNNSIDNVLQYCATAEKLILIGPTAGFLPDPLFKRGITCIGGTRILNVQNLKKSIQNGTKWGDSVQKYTLVINEFQNN